MRSKVDFQPGDRVCFSQAYLPSEPEAYWFGSVGTVDFVSGDQASVHFDDFGQLLVRAADLELDTEDSDSRDTIIDDPSLIIDLMGTDKNTLIREKLAAQENNPAMDKAINSALIALDIQQN